MRQEPAKKWRALEYETLPVILPNQTTFQDEFSYSTKRLARGEWLLVDNQQLTKASIADHKKPSKFLTVLLAMSLLWSASTAWAANEGNDWIPSCTGDCVSTVGETIGGVSVPYGTVAALNASNAQHIGELGRGINGGVVGRTEDYERDVERHLAENRANNVEFNRVLIQSAAQGVQDTPNNPLAQETLSNAVKFAKQVEQGTDEYEAKMRHVLISYEKNKN